MTTNNPCVASMRAEVAKLRAQADAIERECDDIERIQKRQAAERTGQLWLGKFIAILRDAPQAAQVVFDEGGAPTYWCSYRGVKADLALGFDPDKEMTVADLLEISNLATTDVFYGYRGGEYYMTEDTVLWRANFGDWPGRQIIGVEMRDGVLVILTRDHETE